MMRLTPPAALLAIWRSMLARAWFLAAFVLAGSTIALLLTSQLSAVLVAGKTPEALFAAGILLAFRGSLFLVDLLAFNALLACAVLQFALNLVSSLTPDLDRSDAERQVGSGFVDACGVGAGAKKDILTERRNDVTDLPLR